MNTFTVKHPYNSPGHIALAEALEDRKIVQHAGRSCVVLSRKTTGDNGNVELVTSFELAEIVTSFESVDNPKGPDGVSYALLRGWAYNVAGIPRAELDDMNAEQILGAMADKIPIGEDHRDRAIRWLTELLNRSDYPIALPWRVEKYGLGWYIRGSNDEGYAIGDPRFTSALNSFDPLTEEIVAAVNAAHLRHDIGAFDVDGPSAGASDRTQSEEDTRTEEFVAAVKDHRALEDLALLLEGVLRRYSAATAERITRSIPRRLEAAALPMDVRAASIEAYRSECEYVDRQSPEAPEQSEPIEREPVMIVLGGALKTYGGATVVITRCCAAYWHTDDGTLYHRRCNLSNAQAQRGYISSATDAMLTAYFDPRKPLDPNQLRPALEDVTEIRPTYNERGALAALAGLESCAPNDGHIVDMRIGSDGLLRTTMLDANVEPRKCGTMLREADELNSRLRSERAKLEAAIKSFDVTLTDLTGHPRVMTRSLAHDIEEALRTLRGALR